MDLKDVEDKLLLSGYIAMLFDDYTRAQELFLLSSYPIAALEMRKDLLQWDQALALANILSMSVGICDICMSYAMQLEFNQQDLDMAMNMYKKALQCEDIGMAEVS